MKNEEYIGVKNIHYSLFLISYFLLIPFSYGQPATIKGRVDATYLSQANIIYAYTFSDYISYSEKELASSMIDAKGNFEMHVPVSGPTFIFLTADNARAEMTAEQGKIYDITLLPKDSDAVNTLSIAVPVEIEFNNSDKQELNFLIADFTNRYEAFLEYHRPLIAKKSLSVFGKIDTMKILCNRKYSSYHITYLNNHIEYTFASLEESITLAGKEKLFRYISEKPVLLNNYDYMGFFHQFYTDIVRDFMNAKKTQLEINGKQNFSSLMEYFRQNKFLTNDTVRETVILKCLSEYSVYPVYKLNAVLSVLKQAAGQCKAEENRRSAENLIKKLYVMKQGSAAPQLFFQDINGKNKSLNDFKGKYVYLIFWASWCSSCTQELLLVNELKKQYERKIDFVIVSVDKKPDAMKNFLNKNPKLNSVTTGTRGVKGITFLHCNNYKKVKEEFGVLTVPTYYIIDPMGNVLKSPAEKPQNIEPVFNQIFKKK